MEKIVQEIFFIIIVAVITYIVFIIFSQKKKERTENKPLSFPMAFPPPPPPTPNPPININHVITTTETLTPRQLEILKEAMYKQISNSVNNRFNNILFEGAQKYESEKPPEKNSYERKITFK